MRVGSVVVLAIVIVAGVLLLAGLVVVCYAANKIKAESFEFSAGIWKILSLSIKIVSPNKRGDREGSGPEP